MSITRRVLLQTMAAAGAVATTGWVRAEEPQGSYDGVRFDPERNAILLTGEPGSYADKGVFTSAPFALQAAAASRVSWRPRWTTPLQWDRFEGNPILKSSPGSWDDSVITTCSIVPSNDALKMFYGARDRGIGLAEGHARDLSRWRKRERPLLEAGSKGAFDAGGVLSPAIVPVSDSLWYMYYVGYDPTRVKGAIKVHQIGLAQSTDQGETWARVSTEPVLPLGPPGSCDGATISSNTVLKLGDRWYSWYTGISQIPYLASICLATSGDGIHWDKYPHNPVLSYNPYVETDAFMVATPQVLHEEGVFKMWYNSKGFGEGRSIGNYRIGYAESLDGIHWERCAKLPVLGPSGSGWDATMVEYPEVLNIGGTHYMWYCGEGYGTIGYAKGRTVTSAVVETRTGSSATPDSRWSAWTAHDDPLASALKQPRAHAQMRVTLQTTDRGVTPMVQNLSVQ